MPAAAIVSIAIAAVLVLALAWYLAKVVRVLQAVNDSLGKITFGVRAISHRTQPVGALVTAMNDDLVAVAGALEALVAAAASAHAAGDRAA